MRPPARTRHAGSRHRRLALLALLLALLLPRAQAADELPLKAAILFNLLLFVEWPGEAELPAGAPLLLCADRAAPLWPHLQALRERPVRQRRLDLRDAADAEAARGCHAWLLEDGGARLPAPRPGAPLLVIGDGARADERGVAIALRSSGARVVFDIDMALVRQQRLQLSSKLLRLARVVRE